MRDTDTLHVHAERRLVELGRRLSDFQLLDSRETKIGGHPAVQVHYAWAMESVPFEETLAFVEDVGTPRSVLLFRATSLRTKATVARVALEHLLASVAFDTLPTAAPMPVKAPSGPGSRRA
jgi:hypothetical protein